MKSTRETSIERMIRENTPDFVIGTSYFVEKYHSFRWQCPVHFADGVYVNKGADEGNGLELKKYDMAYPDFVLLDRRQCETLDKAIYNADNGLDYVNPFLRKHGWYIEAFGDYWHSREIVGMDEHDHEMEVVKAYESSGNHVLVLWEHDIRNHWHEVCEPKLNEFIEKFKREHSYSGAYCFDEGHHILSDDAIRCLNDNEYYRSMDSVAIVDELCRFYNLSVLPFYNRNMADMDARNVRRKYDNAEVYAYSLDGRMMLDCFVRSRMYDRCRGSRPIDEIWHDMALMKKAIFRCFDEGAKTINSNVILNKMIEMNGYAVPRDLSFWHTLGRVKRFSMKGGLFFDPCAGYGERMVASWLMGMKYVGIVDREQTRKELEDMSGFLGYDAEI